MSRQGITKADWDASPHPWSETPIDESQAVGRRWNEVTENHDGDCCGDGGHGNYDADYALGGWSVCRCSRHPLEEYSGDETGYIWYPVLWLYTVVTKINREFWI